MKVFTIAGPKGGCGKSTTAISLAVRATEESGRVAMIDLNEDLGTLGDWWVLRGRPINPFLHDADGTLDALVNGLRADGWTHCFIDGPPYEQDLIEMSVIVADAVLIPIKLAYFDTSAIDSILGMCRRRRKPHMFVVNEFDDRKQWAISNKIGLEMLRNRAPLAAQKISAHPKYRIGQIEGKTGAELGIKGRLRGPVAAEIDALWAEAKQLAESRLPEPKLVEGGRG